MLLIWGAFGIYYLCPFGEFIFTKENGLHIEESIAFEVLFYLACFYSFVSVFFLLNQQKKGEESKFVFLIKKLSQKDFDSKAKNTILFFLVKFFFIPLMVPWTVEYILFIKKMILTSHVEYESFIQYFNQYLFMLLVSCLGFIALAYYSFGYLIESSFLNSKVKSVEPTIFGWVVTLICYVPFITLVTRVIPFYTNDMAFFVNNEVTFIVRIGLVLVMLFKVWSIAILGAKCSNLTNRGIVTSGPYRWVRHPHYLSKLIVWWVTFLPVFIYDFWTVGTMIFWTMIYVFRALTEENHLGQDEDYKLYSQKVKWRFIPYLY